MSFTVNTSTYMSSLSASPPPLSTRQRLRLPLTAAFVVCRAHPGLEPLATAVSAFIDAPRRWTIELACERGDLPLLQRLVALEASIAHPLTRSHVFSHALVHAVRHATSSSSSSTDDSDSEDDSLAFELLECLRAYCPSGFASKGMEEAALLGNVRVMQWITDNCPNLPWNCRFAQHAAGAGHVHVLKWLKDLAGDARQCCFDVAKYAAASAGHLPAVKWLHKNTPKVTYKNLYYRNHSGRYADIGAAMKNGHVDVVEYLFERYPWLLNKRKRVDWAVRSGSLEMVEWLSSNKVKPPTVYCVDIAAHIGSAELVRWSLKSRPTVIYHDSAIMTAAHAGHAEIIPLFHTFCNLASYSCAMNDAAKMGNFAVLQQLYPHVRPDVATSKVKRKEKLRMDDLAVGCAGASGSIEIMQWLHERRPSDAPPPSYEIHHAAESGHLHAVQWLAERSQTIHPDPAMTKAAVNGHLDVLMWLHENVPRQHGYCVDEDTMDIAAANGHLAVLQWFCAHPAYRLTLSYKAMDLAAKNNHLHVVKWLHANRREGCTKAAMDDAASIEMVEWLHFNRSEGCTTLAMDNAAKRGDFETLVFLHEHRREGCSVLAAANAHANEHLDIFHWLVQTYPDVMVIEEIRKQVPRAVSLRRGGGNTPPYTSSLLRVNNEGHQSVAFDTVADVVSRKRPISDVFLDSDAAAQGPWRGFSGSGDQPARSSW